jgi:hypothetical protein
MKNMFETNYSLIFKIGLKPSLDSFKRIISLDEFYSRVGITDPSMAWVSEPVGRAPYATDAPGPKTTTARSIPLVRRCFVTLWWGKIGTGV